MKKQKPESEEADVVIIGYGNSLRGDDAAGLRVIERLADIPGISHACRLVTAHQLLPEHAALISKYNTVIFVDASNLDAAGTAVLEEMHLSKEYLDFSFVAHQLSPRGVLISADKLFGATPEAFVCRIGVEDFGLSDKISLKAELGVQKAVDIICAQLANSR